MSRSFPRSCELTVSGFAYSIVDKEVESSVFDTFTIYPRNLHECVILIHILSLLRKITLPFPSET